MFAKNLSLLLHRQLSEAYSYDETLKRFETLRGYGQLPRGRDKAGQRLTDEEIARAILGYVPTQSGWAGHVALIMSDLRPVGGMDASFQKSSSLVGVMAALLNEDDHYNAFVSLTLSIARVPGNDKYQARIVFDNAGERKSSYYVSKYATSLTVSGAEETYDHERPLSSNTHQLVLNLEFFRNLKRNVDLARHWNIPLETDWREYKTEEERDAFHKRLGASANSRFLNLRVDAQVTWPKEPTRINFGGLHLVLFPKTKDHSHSVSIDLTHNRTSAENARTLINRMLSVMSWCDDQPASLHEGWPGNPVPVPVPKQNLAFATMHEWHFYRELSNNEDLLQCLAFYRDGLNANSVSLASHAVLSFFRVFETKYDTKRKVKDWIVTVFPDVELLLAEHELQAFEEDRELAGVDLASYVYVNCRVATAHAASDARSDPDGAEESRRLFNAARIIQRLARYFINQEFEFSDSYLTD